MKSLRVEPEKQTNKQTNKQTKSFTTVNGQSGEVHY